MSRVFVSNEDVLVTNNTLWYIKTDMSKSRSDIFFKLAPYSREVGEFRE
jgi:hypothetical protein